MNVILIDNDEPTLIILKRMLGKIDDVQVIGAFQNTENAEAFLKTNNVDIVFIDINMPGESGIDFAKRILRQMDSIETVFVTSYKEYALEAFGVYAFDYIVKPINHDRIYETIAKIRGKKLHLKNASHDEDKKYKLFIYCLGGLEIRSAIGEFIKLPSSKSKELLSYLLVNSEKPVCKWQVIEEVFPGMPEDNAEIYLNTTIYKLRKALQPYGLKNIIISANRVYKLETKDIYIDFIDFEDRISLPINISRSMEEAVEIENMYTGDLFGTLGYLWALPEKERLATIYWNFAKELIRCFLEEKNYYLALKILKKLECIDELDEEINLLLMQVYASNKDKVNLTRQYKRYKDRLQKELNIKPDIRFIELYKKLNDSL